MHPNNFFDLRWRVSEIRGIKHEQMDSGKNITSPFCSHGRASEKALRESYSQQANKNFILWDSLRLISLSHKNEVSICLLAIAFVTSLA